MKISSNFIKRNIAGETVIIPTGEAAQYFNGMITMNEVAEFIWDNIEKCNKKEEMIELVMEEFDGNKEEMTKDVGQFMNNLIEVGMVEI